MLSATLHRPQGAIACAARQPSQLFLQSLRVLRVMHVSMLDAYKLDTMPIMFFERERNSCIGKDT